MIDEIDSVEESAVIAVPHSDFGEAVVSGGEIGSFVFLDAIIRLLPGVLGNDNSIDEDMAGYCSEISETIL